MLHFLLEYSASFHLFIQHPENPYDTMVYPYRQTHSSVPRVLVDQQDECPYK